MKYKVIHRTEYLYGESVPLCHNVVRLRPRDTGGQICRQCELAIRPVPAERRDRIDFFGNHATWLCVQEPHERLRIDARSDVDVTSFVPPSDLAGPPWEQAAAVIAGSPDSSTRAAKEYTFDSPYIPRNTELADYARPTFTPGAPLLRCAVELTQRIQREFTFDSGATCVGTPVLDVLRHRHGVCQDFAHLQIGCLRSLGLAARYVSGYLVTRPPPGRQRLVGVDASHAWLSVFVPGFGWIDLDPTNGVIPTGEHITLGWARDYDDLSPVKGVIIGGHRHALRFSVDVEPVVAEGNGKPEPPRTATAGMPPTGDAKRAM